MKQSNVPQDNVSTYAGNRKAIYAVDDQGRFGIVASTGWEAEEAVTRQALDTLEAEAEEAYREVEAGLAAPLLYHMYARRMDLQLLSESTGLFKWRIRRHFKPALFAKLPDKILIRYADALGMDLDSLRTLPPKEQPHDD